VAIVATGTVVAAVMVVSAFVSMVGVAAAVAGTETAGTEVSGTESDIDKFLNQPAQSSKPARLSSINRAAALQRRIRISGHTPKTAKSAHSMLGLGLGDLASFDVGVIQEC
jgi:hypothetical protein